jgi:transcriptional regulator with XRE-family HTH domain
MRPHPCGHTENVIDRPGLAEFLRRRRAGLTPSDIGLPDTSRRRTPGLRREEVAVLAGISSDFYAQLEQARGSDPSESVVAALARALRCTPDEKDHLFRLAGVPIPPRQVGHHIDPGLFQLAAHLDGLPTCIYNDLGDVLYTNALDDALTGCDELRPGRDYPIQDGSDRVGVFGEAVEGGVEVGVHDLGLWVGVEPGDLFGGAVVVGDRGAEFGYE